MPIFGFSKPAYEAYEENRRLDAIPDGPVARCVNGTFAGTQDGAVASFKGIPYVAEQPVGGNRWRAPVPFREDDGIYEARHFGHAPLQTWLPWDRGSKRFESGEDCLHLNVWVNTSDPSTEKTVMVWIFGGAFLVGSSADPMYDGAALVRENSDVVLVSVDYRLGFLGFANLEDVPGGEDYPDSANLGILDQAMALRWVHENISAFGGDPGRITIFGESAGAASVSILLSMPEVRPMVRRAIMESGSPDFTRSPEESRACTRTAMRMFRCRDMDDFRRRNPARFTMLSIPLFLKVWPERDGRTVPSDLYAEFDGGLASEVDILEGSNKDEESLFLQIFKGLAVYKAYLSHWSKAGIAKYPDEERRLADSMVEELGGGYRGRARFTTMVHFSAPATRLSEGHSANGGRTYQYFWSRESARRLVGAAHTIEIPAVFCNSGPTVADSAAYDTSSTLPVQRMWVNFARTGDPSLSAEESMDGEPVEWPPYEPGTHVVMEIGDGFMRADGSVRDRQTSMDAVRRLVHHYCK